MGLEIQEFLGAYDKSAREVILCRSTDPPSNRFNSWPANTKQHTTNRLDLLRKGSVLNLQICNLKDLHLLLAEKWIQQNDRIQITGLCASAPPQPDSRDSNPLRTANSSSLSSGYQTRCKKAETIDRDAGRFGYRIHRDPLA